jgi:hypothetical protein
MKKKNKTIKGENAQEVWKKLNLEVNKIMDNFKYFDEANKTIFLNILIAESIKASNIEPLRVKGLISQIEFDIGNFIHNNLSNSMQKTPNYVG